MYEDQTFDAIMARLLSRVPDDIDKREGSIIWNALAPAARELEALYIELDLNYDLSFADTATGEFLSRRTAEFGVNRRPATRARREGRFYDAQDNLMDVPIGSRFAIDNTNYTVISKISTGVFVLECEQPGAVGNLFFGTMLPIDYVEGLARAELGDVLVPGEDEEDDETLRRRYFQAVNEPPFGGNVADYKQKVGSIDGVGGVKVFPAWQGGGTAKCTIIASDFNSPSQLLIDEVQEIIDPLNNQGQGLGLAPIGHRVTIAGVQEVTVNVETTVTLSSGMTPGQVQGPIEGVISDYLLELRRSWADEEQLVVRIAQIEARILTVPGVIDVGGTTLNGTAANLVLGEEQIPQLGAVTIYAN